MRTILALCTAAVLMPGMVWAQGSAAEGEKVYTAQKCMVCHSVAGKGNKNGALDEVGSKLTADQIRQWIVDAPAMTTKTKATRKPPMKSYTLPKGELDSLVAYMQSLKKK